MVSLHYGKILKQVVTRLWETLPARERDIVAGDTERATALARWFDTTVAYETKSRYESLSYEENDESTFRYSQSTMPAGW